MESTFLLSLLVSERWGAQGLPLPRGSGGDVALEPSVKQVRGLIGGLAVGAAQ